MPPTWLTKKNNQTRKTMAKRNAHKKQKQENKPATTSLSIQQLYKSKIKRIQELQKIQTKISLQMKREKTDLKKPPPLRE